jgi:hypothetical protein
MSSVKRTKLLLPLLLAAGTASAQWPRYMDPRFPKTADGKPNPAAAAPKSVDGHTDFSGVWDYTRPPGMAPPPPPPAAATAGGGLGPGPRPGAVNQFFNIGSTLPGGLPFQPWAAKLRAERTAANNKDNPDAHCLPMGFMQFHTHPQPRRIVQTPTMVVIIYEANYGLRQIYMDGRTLPAGDVENWWYGYSVGHWDGDTLVVETTHIRDLTWLDVEGSPITSEGKVTERMRRTSYGNMETEITVDDPKAYTKPWTVKVYHKAATDDDLIEFVCNENEKDASHLVSN